MLIHLTCFQQFAISSVSDVFPVLLLLLLGEAVQQGLFFFFAFFSKESKPDVPLCLGARRHDQPRSVVVTNGCVCALASGGKPPELEATRTQGCSDHHTQSHVLEISHEG